MLVFQDQSVEESNSVCKECEEKIESAFDFKSCIVPSGSEEQTQKGTNDPSTSTGESSAEKAICHLCKISVNATAVISLPKVLKDDSMMEVFQGHIPEMVSGDKFYISIWSTCYHIVNYLT